MIDLVHHDPSSKSLESYLLRPILLIEICEDDPSWTPHDSCLPWDRKTCFLFATELVTRLGDDWVDHADYLADIIAIWCLHSERTSDHTEIDTCLGCCETDGIVVGADPVGELTSELHSL